MFTGISQRRRDLRLEADLRPSLKLSLLTWAFGTFVLLGAATGWAPARSALDLAEPPLSMAWLAVAFPVLALGVRQEFEREADAPQGPRSAPAVGWMASLETVAAWGTIAVALLVVGVQLLPARDLWVQQVPQAARLVATLGLLCYAVARALRSTFARHAHGPAAPYSDVPHARLLIFVIQYFLLLAAGSELVLAPDERATQRALAVASCQVGSQLVGLCLLLLFVPRWGHARRTLSFVLLCGGLIVLVFGLSLPSAELLLRYSLARPVPLAAVPSDGMLIVSGLGWAFSVPVILLTLPLWPLLVPPLSRRRLRQHRETWTAAVPFVASCRALWDVVRGLVLRLAPRSIVVSPAVPPLGGQLVPPAVPPLGKQLVSPAVPPLGEQLSAQVRECLKRGWKLQEEVQKELREALLVEWYRVLGDLVRGRLFALAIFRENTALLGLTLPWSGVLAIYPYLTMRLSAPEPAPSPLTVFALWITATAAWLTPFLSALRFAEDTLARAFRLQLQRAILRLHDHVLVLGHGDLGRAVVRAVLEKRILAYENPLDHCRYSENVLLPDGRLGKLLLQVAAVDTAARPAPKSAGELPIGTIDVRTTLRRLRCDKEWCRPDAQVVDLAYLVPQIFGDVTQDEVTDFAQMRSAQFVVCAVRPEARPEPSQTILRRLEKTASLEGRRVPAMIAVHSSTYARSVASTALRLGMPVHSFSPSHIEGLNAAAVLYAAYIKFRGRSNDPRRPRMLVAGRGRRITYLMDAFMRRLRPGEWRELRDDQNGADPRLMIIARDPLFEALRVHPTPATGTQSRLKAVADAGLEVRWTRFERLIGRNPRVGGNGLAVNAGWMRVPHVPAELVDYEVCRSLLNAWMPDVVLLADHEVEGEIRALHALVAVIKRSADERSVRGKAVSWPLVLVSGETGRRSLARRLQRRLLHYSSLPPEGTPPVDGSFPDQRLRRGDDRTDPELRGDAFIDVLDDPVERVTGTIRAYQKGRASARTAGRGRGDRSSSTVAEIAVCGGERTGGLAANLAALGGFSLADISADGEEPSAPVVSVRDVRLVILPQDEFILRCYGYLSRAEAAVPPRFSRLAIAAENQGSEDSHARWARALWSPDPNMAAQGEPALDLDQLRRETANSAAACCGMPTCPVEPFHQMSESGAHSVFGDLYERWDPEKAAEKRVANARTFNSRFACGELPSADQPEASPPPENEPFASIRVRCSGAGKAGTFGLALSALALRTLAARPKPPERVFNITYLSAYDCHDDRFAVFNCFGWWEPPTSGGPDRRQDVLQSIEIRPVTGREHWDTFANRLIGSLNKPTNHEQEGAAYEYEYVRESVPGAAGPVPVPKPIRIIRRSRLVAPLPPQR